jgi:hypothetical protein
MIYRADQAIDAITEDLPETGLILHKPLLLNLKQSIPQVGDPVRRGRYDGPFASAENPDATLPL